MITISISPGRRQRLCGSICKDISEIRRLLDRLEEEAKLFYEEGKVILALNTGYLSESVGRLTYRVGEANGALTLPDLVDNELAKLAGKVLSGNK